MKQRNNDYYLGGILRFFAFLLLICVSIACAKKDTNIAIALATQTGTGGYSTATGAGAAAAETVSTLDQLQTAFNNRKHHIIIKGHIYGGAVPKTFTFATTDWNGITIEGVAGDSASLENIQLKFSGEMLSEGSSIQNIIVKNISFYGNIRDLQALPASETDISKSGAHSGVNYEGVSFRRCTNVTLDHCNIYNTSDDLWSVSLSSDNITISYCHFHFTSDWINMDPNPKWNWVGNYQPLAAERLCAVLGSDYTDSYTYGSQKLHVTMHDNWFGPLLKGRPLCRGYIHCYNNYFDNSIAGSDQYNAIQIGSGSRVYSENNYFDQIHLANQVGLDDATHTAYTFCERNNVYSNSNHGVTGTNWPDSLPVPYHYTLMDTSTIRLSVQANAGPR